MNKMNINFSFGNRLSCARRGPFGFASQVFTWFAIIVKKFIGLLKNNTVYFLCQHIF